MSNNSNKEVLSREYKDSIFRLVFGQPEKMIELYNAIFDTNYPPDTKININTIDEVFYKTQKNDISFTIDGTYIMLSEHQSTINPNMPMRDLFYIVEIWKSMVEKQSLYKRKRVTIPQPKFIVLYNGREPMPPVSTLELADSFLGDRNNALLNLKVLVYNVNEGMNCDILKKSPTLYQYSQLVALIREFQARGPVTSQDMREITRLCHEKGILVNFMKEYANSIIDLLHYEITQEEAIELSREDGYEAGFEKGHIQGTAIGQERVNKLILKLTESGRLEDLQKSAADPEYQQALFDEFGL